jgi:hypothetical protein
VTRLAGVLVQSVGQTVGNRQGADPSGAAITLQKIVLTTLNARRFCVGFGVVYQTVGNPDHWNASGIRNVEALDADLAAALAFVSQAVGDLRGRDVHASRVLEEVPTIASSAGAVAVHLGAPGIDEGLANPEVEPVCCFWGFKHNCCRRGRIGEVSQGKIRVLFEFCVACLAGDLGESQTTFNHRFRGAEASEIVQNKSLSAFFTLTVTSIF